MASVDEHIAAPRKIEAGIGSIPWWLLSAGLHVVLILTAALFYYVERALATDAGVLASLRVQTTTPRFSQILDPENSDFGKRRVLDEDEHFDYRSDEPFGNGVMRGCFPDAEWEPRRVIPCEKGKRSFDRPRRPREDESLQFLESVPLQRPPRSLLKDSEVAVPAPLIWLARHQNPDGSWGAASFADRCTGARCSGPGSTDFDVGETGLALLAFLGAGFVHHSQDIFADPQQAGRLLKFGEGVRDGLKWLIRKQDVEGCVGPRGQRHLYNHAIAALALSEAYGLTASRFLKDPAQQAINFLVMAQNPGKGWRYSAGSGENDSSVTGWAVLALKSAEHSGLSFPKSAYDGALAWFSEATDLARNSRVGYTRAGTGKNFVPGKNELFEHHETMSAIAILARMFIRKDRGDPARLAISLLSSDLPEWKGMKIDFYYWYFASLAQFQFDGPAGPHWKRWSESMKNALVPHQRTNQDGCRNGSWDPEADRWGFEGGRVYATALNMLTLEIYYRYSNGFGGSGR